MKSLVFIVTSVLVMTASLTASAPRLSTSEKIVLACTAQVLDAARAAILASEATYRVASENGDIDDSEKHLMVASGTLCAWTVVLNLAEGLRSSLKSFRDDMDEDMYDEVNDILRELSSLAKSMTPEGKDIHGINRANRSAASKVKELGSKLTRLVDSSVGISDTRTRSL